MRGWINKTFLKEGDVVKIIDDKVAEEWRGIEAIIIKKEKHAITKMRIIKGNKYHRKGGKLFFFPYRLVIK